MQVIASSSACCITKSATQSTKKLLRLWLTVRVFFILFGITFWLLLINSPFINSFIRFNIAYVPALPTVRLHSSHCGDRVCVHCV